MSFEARAKAEAWDKLIRQLRFDIDECAHGLSAAFVALPSKLQELSPYLMGEVNVGTRSPKTASWTFEWARAPTKRPPKEVVTHSKSVGSFPQILKALGRLWPSSPTLKMAVSATYFINTDEWELGLPLPPARAQASKLPPRLVPTHWRVEPPAGPLETIVLEPQSDEDFVFLTGKGVFTRKWSPDFLNEADGAVWSGLKALIKRR